MSLATHPFRAGVRRRALCLALACTAALTAPAAVAVDTFSLSGHVVASGAAQGRQSACFTVSGTAGQAVAGAAGDAISSVASGFWRAFPPQQDSVFASSFEDCGS